MSDIKEAERAELHKTIWLIASDLRGSVDGWDFKTYVLGMLFYRFISENLTASLNEQERKAGLKRNEKLVKLLDAIRDLKLGTFSENMIDAFGDAYEFLMTMYASSAGKSGGEFFTPQEVSELLVRITVQAEDMRVATDIATIYGTSSRKANWCARQLSKNIRQFAKRVHVR